MRLLPCLAAIVLLPACNADETSVEADATGTTYYEMTSRLSGTNLSRWNTDKAALDNSFGNVCGDTFCSGDYSNLSTVAITCSITQANYVKECLWALGGSIEYVDGATGKFTVDARTFACTIPVKTKLPQFLDALENGTGEVIHRNMPGTGQSFYDGIGACLSGVVGNAPPPDTGTTYEELADYFNEHGDPGDWYSARWQLAAKFDAACAGSFCQGPYPNLAALRYVCATNQTTGNVVGCRWSFAGAKINVTTKGHVSASMKILQCPVSTKGSAAAVEAALSGADPLHAALPGSTSTLAVQLDACL